MAKRVLITGGAGFIGSHLADELLRRGYSVRVLDCLLPQVHGDPPHSPAYLDPAVDFIAGDVRAPEQIAAALRDVDIVYHFAARVGVGQSMYQVADYTATNNDGTATLLEALMHRPLERLVVASSMSIYGEGLYRDLHGRPVPGVERRIERLQARAWDLVDDDGQPLMPIPTPETKPPTLASVYALSKYDQEQMCLIVGRAYGIPTVALRFFNVYGTRQALSNPYTGVLAIFAARLLNGERPLIFEDGGQQRDFVNVRDIAQACRLAAEVPGAAGRVLNIGSGRSCTIRTVAEHLGQILNRPDLEPETTHRHRRGDIRHCFADISLACRILGYTPRIGFTEGLTELAEWLEGQIVPSRASEAHAELELRGLTV